MNELTGIIPALVTPYDSNDAIDPALTRKLVERLLGQGIGGLYVGGSTGEGPLQSPQERLQFLQTVVDIVADRVPVIAHVGTADTVSSIRLAKDAAAAGAAAVSAVRPYYYPHATAQVRAHFLELAEVATVPFIAYHLASQAGTADSLALYDELADHPNIVGLKFTSRDVYTLQQLASSTSGRLVIFNGADEVCVHGLLAGAVGAIGSTYNFMAGLFVDAYTALTNGDIRKAVDLQAAANAVIRAAAGHNSVAFAREVVRAQGLDVGSARRPIEQLGPDDRARVADLVARTPFLRA